MELFYVTSKGLEYFAQTAVGKTVHFTKGKFGDGVTTGNVAELTDLINPIGEMGLLKTATTASGAIITTQFSNMKSDGSLINTFYLKEIGLFAKVVNADGTDDELKPETLVAYAFATGDGDRISGTNLTEFVYNWPCSISNTENVTVTIGSVVYAKQSIKVDAILTAGKWVDDVYVWENSNITSSEQIIELVPQQGITVEQLNALQFANIVGTGQTAGAVTMTAFAGAPTEDIPVTFIIRGDV